MIGLFKIILGSMVGAELANYDMAYGAARTLAQNREKMARQLSEVALDSSEADDLRYPDGKPELITRHGIGGSADHIQQPVSETKVPIFSAQQISASKLVMTAKVSDEVQRIIVEKIGDSYRDVQATRVSDGVKLIDDGIFLPSRERMPIMHPCGPLQPQKADTPATAEESQWYLWAVATMWNKPVDCNVYHATPEQAIEAMNNYSEGMRRNLSPSSPTQGFIVSYQLVDNGGAGLVTETVPPGVPTGGATLHFFRSKDACLAYARTQH